MILKRIKLFKAVWFIVINFLLLSCLDKDYMNLQDTAIYAPEISIPIGKVDVDLESLVEDYGEDFEPILEIIDSLLHKTIDSLPDTVLYMLYDNFLYESPLIFEFNTEQAFNFSEVSSNLEYVTRVMIRTNVINGIPGKLSLQVYFSDANRQIIDSVYQDGWFTIESAITDSSGFVTESYELWEYDVYFEQDQIESLDQVRYVLIRAELDVTQLKEKIIRYSPEQKFKVQVGARVALEIPLHAL